MFRFISFIIIFLLLPQNGITIDFMTEKPDNLQSCKFSDPEFIKCSTKTVQDLFGMIIKGIDGIENLPTIDPLKINRLRIFQGAGPVNVNASLVKVTIKGFKNVKVLESRVNSTDFSWKTKFVLPKMRLDGVYDLNGRILIIPLRGHGKLWIEATNMSVIMKTKTKLYEKYDHVFYNVTSSHIDFDIGGLRLNLDNLFDGIKSLEESTNIYLNQNWRPASDALKPVIAKTIEDILLDIMRKIFHFVPADFIVTDIPKPSELKKRV